MDKWVGKLALVTGASAGIGTAIAESLVKQGVNVVGCARNVEKLKEIAANLEKESGKFCPFVKKMRFFLCLNLSKKNLECFIFVSTM